MKTFIAAVFASAFVSGLASAAFAESAKEKQAIIPEGQEWIPEEYGYSPAVRAGDFIFAAGVVAGLRPNEDGELPELTDENMEASFDRAFQYVGFVLAAAGADWDDVVEMTTYHTDLPSQGALFMKVKERYVKAPFPAWTSIDVDRLWADDGIAEIRVIAYAPVEE